MTLKVYRADAGDTTNKGKTIIIVHPTEHLKSNMSENLCMELFQMLGTSTKGVKRILILDTTFKTFYTSKHGVPEVESGKYPLRFYKSSTWQEDPLFKRFLTDVAPKVLKKD